MAGIEVLASLVTLAGVGVRLSKTLYQAGHKSVQADHNINRIATNVTLFSSSLKHVGATISDTRSLHTPEALDTVKQIVEESNSVFKEITNIVLTATNNKTGDNGEKVGANGRRRRLSLLSRARWYFDQPVAERLLAQLEYLKTTLSVLLQTLNLAATMANVRRIDDMSEDEVRRVELERAHVETLVIAQHLSVVVLDKYQSIVDGPDYPVQSSSTSESEATVNRRPKLLTQGSANTSMIKLEGNDLNFLERQGSNESDLTAPPINSAQAFVDQLLQRWARLPSRLDIAQEREKEIDLESQADSGDAPTPPKQQRPVLKPEDRDESVPDLKLHPVQSEPAESLSPTNEGLLDTNAPTKTTETRSSTSESSRELSQEDAAPVSSGGYQSNTPAPRRSAFNRTSSNPESEGQLQLQNFQGHQIASNIQRPASAQPDAIQMPPRSPASPGPSPSNALSTMSYYTNRSPPMMATNPYYARAQKPSNYRPPYVMSTCSSSSDTGSDTERSESPPPGRRRKFSQARRDSNTSKASNRGSNGSSNGLGIPWRIRITRDKYFDFRDEKLVGPRTPYLPTEPLSWVYSHDNAVTEVSQRWVNEEAITEKRFAFNEARNAPDPGTGEEIAIWRIMQPLKFNEIEGLVSQSAAIYARKTSNVNNSANPVPSSRPYLRNHTTTGPQHLHHGPHAPHGPAQRTVSFNGGAANPHGMPPPPPHHHQHSHLHDPNRMGKRSPRGSINDIYSPVNQQNPWPGHPQPPPQNLSTSPHTYGPPQPYPWEQQGAHGPRYPGAYTYPNNAGWANMPPQHPDQGHRGERGLGEGGHRSHRNRGERGHDDRPVSRGKSTKDKEKDKKKSSSMAGTLAKVGALAALLEGLDGAF